MNLFQVVIMIYDEVVLLLGLGFMLLEIVMRLVIISNREYD
jgi:hypothetical protein